MTPLAAGEIRNRIVEVRKVKFADIKAHPRNPKKHGENQRQAFRGAVRELGFISVPLVYASERNGGALTFADGHLRGSEVNGYTGDVAILDIDDAEADKLLLYADPIAAMAEYESQQLDSLLRNVSSDDAALQAMLAGLAAEAGLYPDKKPIADPGPQIDKADALRQQWGVEPGQLWLLDSGKGHPHRLICGDCTDKATVERVMGGERADCALTDVPYGISQESNGLRRLDYGDWDKEDATPVALAAMGLCDDIPTITAFCGDEQLSLILGLWPKRTKRTLAWVKPNPTVINGEYVFLPAIELAAHGRKAGAWFGGKCVRSVWEGTAIREREHPNQKPLDLFIWVIDLTCPPDGIVYDPFGGSGTTGVACEQLGRRARMVEVDPKYCAVILERFNQIGIAPKLIE